MSAVYESESVLCFELLEQRNISYLHIDVSAKPTNCMYTATFKTEALSSILVNNFGP